MTDEAETPQELTPRQVPKDRLVVVETCYHLPWEGEPVSVDERYSRDLSTHEQLYERRCRVGEAWEPLDLGWLTGVGMLVLSNQEGRNLQTRPTPEEQAEMDGRVLEVGWQPREATQFDSPPFALLLVPPGESLRIVPATTDGLIVRCRRGTCKFVVYAWPE